MDIGVLGPLLISLDGLASRVELAPKPRTVFALLAANAGGVVPVSSLVREVWGETPPTSGLRNVQTYVFQSRKMLSRLTGLPMRAVAGQLLQTRPGGYMFSRDAVQFDSGRYWELVTEGREVIRRGDYAEGVSLLRRALGIWRGLPFVDVVAGATLEGQKRWLEESRLGVIEGIAAAEIELGRYHEAAAGLAFSVFENPLHEGLHYQYMRALSMAGNRAHALGVFAGLRHRLVSELGIDPGESIQKLQCSILDSSSPDHAAPGGAPSGYAAPYPPSTGRMAPVV